VGTCWELQKPDDRSTIYADQRHRCGLRFFYLAILVFGLEQVRRWIAFERKITVWRRTIYRRISSSNPMSCEFARRLSMGRAYVSSFKGQEVSVMWSAPGTTLRVVLALFVGEPILFTRTWSTDSLCNDNTSRYCTVRPPTSSIMSWCMAFPAWSP